MQTDSLNQLINEAKTTIDEAQVLLDTIIQNSDDDEDSSTEDKILKIQLVLQYRLNCETALDLLLQMDANLLYFLGIQPRQSAKTNLDHLAFALGKEDLKQILNVLSILAGSLSKIVERYNTQHASFALQHHKEHKIRSRRIRELVKLNEKQKHLNHLLDKSHIELKELVKLQAVGPLYDHIAALRGPISQFHQAIAHGLGKTQQLYHQIEKTPVLLTQLHSLVKKSEEVLQLMPSLFQPQPHYSLKQFDHTNTTEQLEQRAAAKRLRPFIGPN